MSHNDALRHRVPVAALLVATLLTLGPARAQAPDDAPPGRWQPLEAGTGDAAAEAFVRLHGEGWSAYRDTNSGAPRMMVGPGIDTGAPVRADDAGIARARALLEELREVLRVDDPAAFVVERAVSVTNPWGEDLVYINFKQVHDGQDVLHQERGGEVERLALVKFRFHGPSGRVVLVGSDAVPELATPPGIVLGEAEAAGRALGRLPETVASVERVGVRSYVSVRGLRRFLAREVEVVTDAPPHDWKLIFDAHTGDLEEVRDDRRSVDITGNVSAGSLNFPSGPFPGSSFTVKSARSLLVNSVPGIDWTDSRGDFTIPFGGTGVVVIQGRFVGEYAIVSDQSGNGDLGFARNATPGVFQTIVLNSTNVGEYETAEASAYHWITYTRFFLNGYYPAFNGLGLLDVRVNVNATCNAYSYGGRIDLFRSGGGCNNSAFQEVAAHEYGHEFHRWWHGSSSPGGFSEGIGDHIAHFVAGTRVMGRNFHLDGTPVRDYRAGNSANLRQWPCSNCEVHDRGEVWGGFIMDLQDNLISSQGLGGGVLARQLTIPMFASNPADEAEALTEVYLLDDNDASLSNGTPRCTDITAAAQRHSMPVPYVLPVSCGADPSPPSPEYRAPVSALPSAGLDGSPALDGSQLNLWFISPRAGGLGGNDVWTASRPSIAAPWGAPVNVATVSSSSVERSVAVTNDGLTMFLSTNRPGGTGGYDLWSSTRATTVAPWPAPTAILALNTASDEIEPSIAADRLEIVFASNRPGSTGFAIWSAVRATPNASGWDPPVKLRDTSQDDRSPAISDDSTRLTFSTPNVSGDFDLWVSRRTARGFPFSSLWRNVGEVNTTSLEDRPDETSDGFSLYFTRSAFGSGILRADRIQPKMNGPRSGRANTTVSFKLRRDPGDFGYITIGLDALPPTPLTGVIGPLLMIPLGTVASGVHDSNGVVTWTTPVVDAPGTRIYLQGLTQDPGAQWYLSDRLSFLLLP